MSTRWTTPLRSAAGSTRWAILWVPNVTVTSAVTCDPSSSPVSTSTPDGASTATTGTPATASSAATASGRRGGRPPIPTIPSTTTSNPGRRVARAARRSDGERRCIGTPQGPPARWSAARLRPHAPSRRAATPRRRPRAARARRRRTTRHRRCRRTRPAAAPAARSPAEQVEDGVRESVCRPLHQRALGQLRQQCRLGCPDLFDRVGSDHVTHASGGRVLRPPDRPVSGTRLLQAGSGCGELAPRDCGPMSWDRSWGWTRGSSD